MLMNQKVALVPFMVLTMLNPIMGYERIKESWHIEFPTCSRNTCSQKNTNNFVPYQFSLWELAPNKGKGIRLVMLDTGIAGYEFMEDPQYIKHPDINPVYDPVWGSLSVTKHYHSYLHCSSLPDNQSKDSKKVCKDCLPAISIKEVLSHRTLSHGTHSYGLIISNHYGLAPNTEVIVISIFDHEANCTTASLIRGIEKAITLKPDILLIGANLDENIPVNSLPARKLSKLCSCIPWVIVPAGNRGCPYLSQPAGLDNVTLSVGAFGVAHEVSNYDAPPKIFIPSFSQYQPGKDQGLGPDILAPGYLITSTGVPRIKNQGTVQTLSGTSAAAAITAAFIALLLSEFKDKLSKQDILNIIHTATWNFQPNTPEAIKSCHGILDMRMALFMAHVMKQTKLDANIIKKELVQPITETDINFIIKKLVTDHHKKLIDNHSALTLQSSIQNCIQNLMTTNKQPSSSEETRDSHATRGHTDRQGGSPAGGGESHKEETGRRCQMPHKESAIASVTS